MGWFRRNDDNTSNVKACDVDGLRLRTEYQDIRLSRDQLIEIVEIIEARDRCSTSLLHDLHRELYVLDNRRAGYPDAHYTADRSHHIAKDLEEEGYEESDG
jgi:hypothetical protein